MQQYFVKKRSLAGAICGTASSIAMERSYSYYRCHAWQRRPPFPVNLRDLVSLRLEGMQAKYSAGVLR